ncbi:MAG: hypothetical protein NVSMB58_37990 [Terriglobales bacterium]
MNVYGPPGLKAMTTHILKAWKEMIAISTRGMEKNEPLQLKVHEIRPGIVYKDNLVQVTAFSVHHGEWKHAFGYRFDTPDRAIVISGDTRPSAELVDACHRCDILIHEAYSPLSKAGLPDWPKYRSLYHTSTTELAEIARQTQPELLIVYHRTGARTQIPDEQYLKEVHQGYGGSVVIGHDLEIY